jgi:hypothetical protein
VKLPRKCKGEKVVRKKHRARRRIDPSIKPCLCEICGLKFMYPSRLRYHRNAHKGHFPFRCTRCWAAFKNPNARRYHQVNCSA